nr:udp-glycosyltransferase 74f2 [Quercus suber]
MDQAASMDGIVGSFAAAAWNSDRSVRWRLLDWDFLPGYLNLSQCFGLLKLPITSTPISIPGLPVLELEDMPSFITDAVLVNTFYELEVEVVDSISKFCRFLPIGPTIPSFYLDNRVENDKDYGLILFVLDSYCTNWLSTKPEGSVIYVSFGSMANLSNKQMEELAFALKGSNFYFLWVVKASEEAKLPEKFVEDIGNKRVSSAMEPPIGSASN